MAAKTYAIRFNFPEGEVYAGLHKGAAGYAPTLATAMEFDNYGKAQAMLEHAYGPASRNHGEIVLVVPTPDTRPPHFG